MFCNRRACVSRRFCVQVDAHSRGFRRKNQKNSARIGAERAPNAQHKHKNNPLMCQDPRRAMQMPLSSFCKPCACGALKNSAKIHRNRRGLRRKIARIFSAHRTARSPKSSCFLPAVGADLWSTLRMFCNRRACVSRRFCMKVDAISRGSRRKTRKKSA